MKKSKYLWEDDSALSFVIDSYDLSEKEINDSRVQTMFKRSRRNNESLFIINQDYYELPKRTIRAKGVPITTSN